MVIAVNTQPRCCSTDNASGGSLMTSPRSTPLRHKDCLELRSEHKSGSLPAQPHQEGQQVNPQRHFQTLISLETGREHITPLTGVCLPLVPQRFPSISLPPLSWSCSFFMKRTVLLLKCFLSLSSNQPSGYSFPSSTRWTMSQRVFKGEEKKLQQYPCHDTHILSMLANIATIFKAF